MTLWTTYDDHRGNEIVLSGESVRDIAEQLPLDYDGPALCVLDEQGSTRGWVRSSRDWRAA